VLLAVLGGWFAWAASTPGGVSARVNGFVAHVRGDVEQATADPTLRRSADALNATFTRDHRYPNLTADQLRDDPTYALGIGVDFSSCGPRAVVLVALTGSGTVSRLLRDGATVGDVAGRQVCPADVDRPSPWTG